jgi:hypothetical protein
MAEKLFVVDNWVGHGVEHVVQEAKKRRANGWWLEKQRADLIRKENKLGEERGAKAAEKLEEWKAKGEESTPKWVEQSPEWWFSLSSVQEMKRRWKKDWEKETYKHLGYRILIIAKIVEQWTESPDVKGSYKDVLAEIKFGEVLEMCTGKPVGPGQVLEWLNQKAWDFGQERLSNDMDQLELQDDEDREWAKLQEEVWGMPESGNGEEEANPRVAPASE